MSDDKSLKIKYWKEAGKVNHAQYDTSMHAESAAAADDDDDDDDSLFSVICVIIFTHSHFTNRPCDRLRPGFGGHTST